MSTRDVAENIAKQVGVEGWYLNVNKEFEVDNATLEVIAFRASSLQM